MSSESGMPGRNASRAEERRAWPLRGTRVAGPARVPVALPAGALRRLDRGPGGVAAPAWRRRLGPGDAPAGPGRPAAPRAGAEPLDGHGRRPEREGRPLRADVPRDRWSRRPDVRHEAEPARRDPRPA